jgi:hypothetical protein
MKFTATALTVALAHVAFAAPAAEASQLSVIGPCVVFAHPSVLSLTLR